MTKEDRMKHTIAAVALLALPFVAQAQDLPRYDPEAYCDTIADSTSLYNHCVKREQESYNALWANWNSFSAHARGYCSDLVDNYRLLEHCIKRETEAESEKSSFSFD